MKERFSGLDGLRAVALLLVLWLHASYAGYLSPPSWFPYSGRVGVALFFVLSGYLITALLERERASLGRIHLKHFLARRALRIFPAHYAFLAFLAISPSLGGPSTETRSLFRASCYALNLSGGWRDPNVEHTWSLCYEEQYYLVWPLLLSLLGTRWARRLTTAIVLAWPLLRVLKRGSFDLPIDLMLQSTAFETLMAGSALALWFPPPQSAHSRRLPGMVPLGAALGVLAMYAGRSAIPASATVLVPLLRDLFLCLVVAWCAHHPEHRAVKILDSAPMRYLGLLSYSLYLWHPPFLREGANGQPPGWVRYGWPSWLTVVVVAHCSYFLLERPLQKWRARLRLGAPPQGHQGSQPD